MTTTLLPDLTPTPIIAQKKSWGGRIGRSVRRLGWFSLVAILMMAVGLWLGGQKLLLNWATDYVTQATHGQVQFEGVWGSLSGTIHLDRVTYTSKSQSSQIVLKKAKISLKLADLLKEKVTITELRAQNLDFLTLKYTGKPLVLPKSMALPIDLQVVDAQIEHIAYHELNNKHIYNFKKVHAQFISTPTLWNITLYDSHSDFGDIKAKATMLPITPFTLQGKAQLNGKIEQNPYAWQAQVTGPLLDFTAQGKAHFAEVTADLNTRIQIDKKDVVHTLNANIQNYQLHRWVHGAPHATLSGQLEAGQKEGHFFIGTLAVTNHDAGTLQAFKLPIAQAKSKIRFDTHTLGVYLDELQGQLMPSAHKTTGQLIGRFFYDNHQLLLDLKASQISLNLIAPALLETQMNGRVLLKSAERRSYSVQGDLTQKDYTVQVQGKILPDRFVGEHIQLKHKNSQAILNGFYTYKTSDSLLQGEVKHFNPENWGNLIEADLNGRLKAQAMIKPQISAQVQFDIANSRIRQYPFAAIGHFDYRHQGYQINKAQADIFLGSNKAHIQGQLNPKAADLQFTLNANNLAQIDPKLSGTITASGRVFGGYQQAKINAQFNVDANNLSRIHPILSGTLKAHGEVSGALMHPSLNSQFTLEKAQLHNLNPQLQGALNAQGSLQGDLLNPSITAKSDGQSFAYGQNIQIAEWKAGIDMPQGYRAPFSLTMNAQAVSIYGQKADTAQAALTGSLGQHQLSLSAQGKQVQLNATAQGGLQTNGQWQGQITELQNKGQYPFALQQATQVQISPQQQRLQGMVLQVAKSDIHIQSLDYSSTTGLSTQGFARAVALNDIVEFANQGEPLNTTLRFNADWNLQLNDGLNGSFNIERQEGDFDAIGKGKLLLGIKTLGLRIVAQQNNIQGEATFISSRAGQASASFSTKVAKQNNTWGLPSSSPFELKVDADMQSLAWLAALSSTKRVLVDGQLNAHIKGRGTIASPIFSGNIDGKKLSLRAAEYGFDWKNGILEAQLNNNQLVVQQFKLQGGDGHLSGAGTLGVNLDNPELKFKLNADKFMAISRPDRQLVASGVGRVDIANKKIVINAQLKADKGWINLSSNERPTLGSDVLIQETSEKTAKKKAYSFPTALDLQFDLGNDFITKGGGIDANLEGRLRLRINPGAATQTVGNIAITKGTYLAYGQKLTVKQGDILFNGPMESPALNILAIRPNLPKPIEEMGVKVTGTPQALRVNIYAEPADYTDKQIISWLIFGQDLGSSNTNQLGLINSAANSLFNQLNGSENRITSTLGLDEISFNTAGEGDNFTTSIITFGKRLSNKIYVSYNQSLNGEENLFKVRYTISKKWSVQGQAGSDNALDVFYTLSFD